MQADRVKYQNFASEISSLILTDSNLETIKEIRLIETVIIYLSIDQIPLDMRYEFEGYNVAILGLKFPYGFEYLSERASLFISPLTERCFLTLSLALDQYACGTLIGSNGTGKTETIKELAKVYIFISRSMFFMGLCFMGEVNRS